MKKLANNLQTADDLKPKMEEQQLALEREKLKVEWFKAWWTGFSILVPLLIAVGTFFYNSQNQREQARVDFKLKAAEIVFNTQGPTEAKNKATAMTTLFPDYLSSDFAENFIPLDYGSPKISSSQIQLITLIIEHPDQRNEIIDMWLKVAPFDKWAEKLRE